MIKLKIESEYNNEKYISDYYFEDNELDLMSITDKILEIKYLNDIELQNLYYKQLLYSIKILKGIYENI